MRRPPPKAEMKSFQGHAARRRKSFPNKEPERVMAPVVLIAEMRLNHTDTHTDKPVQAMSRHFIPASETNLISPAPAVHPSVARWVCGRGRWP